jgi:hypothetical protein
MTNGSNQSTTATPETPRQKLAYEARHKDIVAANDTARAATQAAILINGGAATAVLAYLAKEAATPANIISAASSSLRFYAIGVFFGAFSMWCSGQASARFAYMWEAFLDNDATGQDKWFKKGKMWLYGHWISFALSILLFIIASWSMARGLKYIPR